MYVPISNCRPFFLFRSILESSWNLLILDILILYTYLLLYSKQLIRYSFFTNCQNRFLHAWLEPIIVYRVIKQIAWLSRNRRGLPHASSLTFDNAICRFCWPGLQFFPQTKIYFNEMRVFSRGVAWESLRVKLDRKVSSFSSKSAFFYAACPTHMKAHQSSTPILPDKAPGPKAAFENTGRRASHWRYPLVLQFCSSYLPTMVRYPLLPPLFPRLFPRLMNSV